MTTINNHNLHCKDIVDTMYKYYNGDMACYDGEDIDLSKCEIKMDDDGDYIEINGENVYLKDLEFLSLYDYFTDVYNIEYIVNGQKEFVAVRLMVACGGPNIYINTWYKQIELYWWTESGKAYIPYELNNAINDVWEEYYNCL